MYKRIIVTCSGGLLLFAFCVLGACAGTLLDATQMKAVRGGCNGFCEQNHTCGTTGPNCGGECPNGVSDCRDNAYQIQEFLNSCKEYGVGSSCSRTPPYYNDCGYIFDCDCYWSPLWERDMCGFNGPAGWQGKYFQCYP